MGIHAVSFQLLFLSSSSAFSFSKAFSFLPSELFLSDHTYIPSISLPFLSSILFSLSLSSFFIFLLWFSCGLLSIQTGLHAILSLSYFFLCFPLSAHSFLSSSVDILQQVVIPFFELSPIMLLLQRYPLGLACMHEWTHTQDWRTGRHTGKS